MKLSVIIPFYNEKGNISFVLDEINEVMGPLDIPYEVIAVDDGSEDATPDILRRYSQDWEQMTVVTFPENKGKDAAMFAGFHAAGGDVIVTLDGDGQNDFHDIVLMLPWLKDYDGVFGARVNRQDPFSKKIVSRVAAFFRKLILKDDVKDTACALKVFKRHALASLFPMRGVHRFIPFLFHLSGLTYRIVPVHHRPRREGRSKFSLKRFYFVSTILDLMFMWWFKLNYIRCQREEGGLGRK